MNKKRILVVENVQDEFTSIKGGLEAIFGVQVEIYPRDLSRNDDSLYNYNNLIAAFEDGSNRYDEIYDFFNPIDLYVLDVSLSSESDNKGIEFYHYLKKREGGNVNAIFVSKSTRTALPLPANSRFVSKPDMYEAYPYDIANEAAPILGLQGPQSRSKKNTDLSTGAGSGKNTDGNSSPDQQKSNDGWLIWRILKTITSYHQMFRLAVIDVLIRTIFYVLIILTTLSAAVNIGAAVWKSLPALPVFSKQVDAQTQPESQAPPAQDGEQTLTQVQGANSGAAVHPQKHDPEPTMLALHTAESIFLNMLPIFIVFGFLNYYETNIREYYIKGNLHRLSEEISTKPMNLSKVLFISSIISFLFVKLIDEIAKRPSDSRDIPIDLISYAAVLLILLGYFAYLNRRH